MAFVTPRTWVAGEVVTAALLNTHLRDDVSFLANPPACRVFNSGAFTLTTSVEAAITFDSERLDTDNMHSTVSNTSRITFNTAGLYTTTGCLQFAANNTGERIVSVLLNGATNIARHRVGPNSVGAAQTILPIGTTYKFAVTDFIELRGYQTTGGNLTVDVSGNYSPEFSAVWIGLG